MSNSFPGPGVTISATGRNLAQGPPGPAGQQGPPGPAGPTGPAGVVVAPLRAVCGTSSATTQATPNSIVFCDPGANGGGGVTILAPTVAALAAAQNGGDGSTVVVKDTTDTGSNTNKIGFTPNTTALSGTVSVSHGSASITFSTNQTLAQGAAVVFASQPGVVYYLASAINAGTAGTLTTTYTGTTNGATTTTTGQTVEDPQVGGLSPAYSMSTVYIVQPSDARTWVYDANKNHFGLI